MKKTSILIAAILFLWIVGIIQTRNLWHRNSILSAQLNEAKKDLALIKEENLDVEEVMAEYQIEKLVACEEDTIRKLIIRKELEDIDVGKKENCGAVNDLPLYLRDPLKWYDVSYSETAQTYKAVRIPYDE